VVDTTMRPQCPLLVVVDEVDEVQERRLGVCGVVQPLLHDSGGVVLAAAGRAVAVRLPVGSAQQQPLARQPVHDGLHRRVRQLPVGNQRLQDLPDGERLVSDQIRSMIAFSSAPAFGTSAGYPRGRGPIPL
jgi:hypothetical protein